MVRSGHQMTMPAAAPLAAVMPVAEEKPGRTAVDAVLAVLDREMSKGDILSAAQELVAEKWGRPKPFALRSWNLALAALSEDGRISHSSHGTYAPVRASLHAVGTLGKESSA